MRAQQCPKSAYTRIMHALAGIAHRHPSAAQNRSYGRTLLAELLCHSFGFRVVVPLEHLYCFVARNRS